ncbi:MAG: glycoside hydrolase family 127 protein [Planctomycetes bacterium]|nr:glycoside hydrolase family 127 protein [Planctomycetota bacterium]
MRAAPPAIVAMGLAVSATLAPAVPVALDGPAAPAAPAEERGVLALDAPPGARFSFGGPLGDRIARNADGWLLPAPAANPGMLAMLRVRDRKPAPQLVPWAGELAGKYLISLVQALRMTDRPDLEEHARRFVAELVAGQAEDGYLGPFPEKDRLLGNWDLWGHYHVMQGLLLWHERTGEQAAFDAAVKTADLVCRTYLDGGRRVFDAGSHEMNMAVIHVLGTLYRKTSDDRYLRMVREIEKDWERAGDYFRSGLLGVDFYVTPRPRWESLHDLQGLVELYRITGDSRYRASFTNLWRSIADLDRHNTGGFSSGEQAVGHPWSPAAIETCCTIAWMAITVDMLRLTGDPAVADELELSTFNGMAGAQHPSGRWWTYNTPMDGVREASAHSIVFQARAGTPELNCCSVNGPRGLGMLSEWAVLTRGQKVAVNYLGPMKAAVTLGDGTAVRLETVTEYPAGGGEVKLVLRPERPARFELDVRIPAWSQRSTVLGPTGERVQAAAGTYHSLEREWRDGDQVTLELDMRLRVLAGDRQARGKVSLYRGPLLLAYDQRLNDFDEDGVPPIDAKDIDGLQAALAGGTSGTLEPWVQVALRCAKGDLRLCDYASAGAHGTRYRSWLPAVSIPAPPLVLDRPQQGEVIPPEKAFFAWAGRRPRAGIDRYVLEVTRAGDPAFRATAASAGTRVVLPQALAPGDYAARVKAEGPGGRETSAERRFRVDAALPPRPEPRASVRAPAPRPDGVLVAAALRGSAAPEHGLLLDQQGVAPAAGPAGEAGGALAFDGEKGRVRYEVPWFPERDYSVALRFAPRSFPQGRIAQLFSAWAAGMDDPLRITVDGGKLSARIEAGGGWSAGGAPLEAGKWVHVAAVKSGPKLTLYVDGEERGSAQVPEEVYSDAASVALGGNPNFGGNEFLPASIAGFALYARALSAEEVRGLAR